MKKMSIFVIGVILLITLVVAVAPVSAVVLPPAVPETGGNSVQTMVKCSGTVLSGTSYIGSQDNTCLNSPPLQTGEVTGFATYSSKTMAVNGVTSLTQTVATNTNNQLPVGDGKNIDAATQFVFDNQGGIGRATGSEDIGAFNAGKSTNAANTLLCPFGDSGNTYNPPFNTMANAYSSYDVSNINLASSASSVNIAKSADTPLSLGYNVAATGQGTITAGLNSNAQDAKGNGASSNNNGWPCSVGKFNDFTTATGNFQFSKVVSFTSGFNL
jgi:hypothetical protein